MLLEEEVITVDVRPVVSLELQDLLVLLVILDVLEILERRVPLEILANLHSSPVSLSLPLHAIPALLDLLDHLDLPDLREILELLELLEMQVPPEHLVCILLEPL